MTSISPGDEVRLKSGGHIMTVASVSDGNALCMWFDGVKQLEKKYPLVVLIKSSDIPPSISIGYMMP